MVDLLGLWRPYSPLLQGRNRSEVEWYPFDGLFDLTWV
jgi:hypothetical protein